MLLSAIVFTGAAIAIVAGSTWWLYFSRTEGTSPARPIAPALGITLAGLLGLASLLMIAGALWDSSMHIQTGLVPGGSDFLWPPHLMIYSAFLLAFAVALGAIASMAVAGRRAGGVDPRRWVRSQPMIGAVVLAAGYSLAAIPGDALWHELVGPDLTAWSPPHLALAAASTAVVLCGLGLLLEARRPGKPSAWLNLGSFLMLGLALNLLYTVGVLEWELPGEVSRLVAERPSWAYPLVAGSLTYFVLALARFSTGSRMAATATAVAFYTIRLGITSVLSANDNVAPEIHAWILPSALVLDLIPWDRIRRRRLRQTARAAGYSATFGLAVLVDVARGAMRVHLSVADVAVSVAGLWLICILMTALARAAGRFLAGEGPAAP